MSNTKFDHLINWLKDLERQQEEIEAEIERVCEMIEALDPGGEQFVGSYLEVPDYKELMNFWINYVHDYPNEVKKALRIAGENHDR